VIPYSRRLDWKLQENALARALREKRDYIDLTASNPTQVGLAPAVDLGKLSDRHALRYEPQPRGLLPAREAIAAYYGDSRGAAVDPERILLTASTSEAYSILFKTLCDPGDCVLVPEPSYPLFGWLTALEGVQPVPYPLRWDGEWHVDAGAIRFPPRARALLAVSPGNPTGAFLKQQERSLLARACAEAECAFVCDEVFADFALGPDPRRVATTAAHDDVLTFTLSGLSKVCGLPQLKLGWCAVSGPRDEVASAMERLELVADCYLSVATPVQLAAAELLASRHEFQRRLLARVRANRAALLRAREAGAAWDVLPAEAGWSAIVAVPQARTEEEWALDLLSAGVLVHPGHFFDFPSGAYVVLSLLAPEGDFARAAREFSRVLHSP
jgi:aspartate/methionine/tyrosine aminotransferase